MSKIAFIPLRCGSKSIKLKNIKNFCGKPLAYWNIKALEDSDRIDEIIVATDCEEVISALSAFKFSKLSFYRRKPENAADTSSTEDVMLEFIQKADLKPEDLFITVQATSPFTQTKHFDEALEKFSKEKYDSLLTCVKVKRFFWNENGTPKNYDYKNRPRRQDFNGELMENGAFYINTVQNIVNTRNRLSGKIGIYEMPEYTSVEIDEESDWIVAENLMQKHILSAERQGKPDIKLFLSDIDGTLTDAGMYYSENGDELKKFSTFDGMGFKLLRESGIKTGIITGEDRNLNRRRVAKLKLDYEFHGNDTKLETVTNLCNEIGIGLENVAYIGDDVNDFELLCNVGFAACPKNAAKKIKTIPNIILLENYGGSGAVREFIEMILS